MSHAASTLPCLVVTVPILYHRCTIIKPQHYHLPLSLRLSREPCTRCPRVSRLHREPDRETTGPTAKSVYPRVLPKSLSSLRRPAQERSGALGRGAPSLAVDSILRCRRGSRRSSTGPRRRRPQGRGGGSPPSGSFADDALLRAAASCEATGPRQSR